jgi:hypothetical protein
MVSNQHCKPPGLSRRHTSRALQSIRRLPIAQLLLRSHFFLAALTITLCVTLSATAYADIPAPPLKRLPGPEKAKALAALAALIILGFSAVLLTWLGARITQRYRQSAPYFRPTPRPTEHDWSRKSITPPEDTPN